MGVPGSAPDVTKGDIRGVFSRFARPSTTPLTTAEVAAKLECAQRDVRQGLEELVDCNELQTKRIDSTTQIWWRSERTGEQRVDPEEFRTFVSAVEEYAIFMLDPDGTVVSWNEGAKRIKGYAEDEIVGDHFSTFYTADDIEDNVPERNLETAIREGRAEDEGWRVDKDGNRFWADVTITAIHDDDGSLRGFTKVTRDTSERREHEQQLRQERDLTQQILETTPVGIAVLDTDGRLVRANRRMLEYHDIDESDVPGYDITSLQIYDDEGAAIPIDEWPWKRALERNESVYDFQCQVDVPGRSREWISVNATPLEASPNEPGRAIVSIDNISDQKKRERRLEQRRAELETELREIFGRVSDAFYALDDEWRFTHANDRAVDPLPYSKEEILGREVWEVMPDSAQEFYREQFQRAMDTQEPVTFEVHEEGFDSWFEFNLYPSETGLSVYFRDNAERVERERELTEYETIVETISDGIYVKDEDGYFTMVNDAYAALTGYDRDDLVGEHASLVVDEAAIAESREAVAAPDEDLSAVETELHTADGESVPVEGTFATLENESNREEIGVVRDITDRKERERRLERYREYTDAILNAIDDIFYLLDEDGDLQRWNETIPEVTGISDAEIESTNALEFFTETGREKIAAAIAEGFETGDAQVEAEILTSDGERIPYEFVASTLENPDGDVVLAGIGRDITDRREYERKLEASNERLEQFAYAASHDLQEPLRMIISYLQLLETRYADELDEDAAEFIEFAVDGATRMRTMIDGLLEYSRVESRGDSFEPVELDEVLEDVLKNLQRKVERNDTTIETDALPRVRGDESQLQQVLQNLISNAIEYSGDDPRRVSISSERSGPQWRVSVRDNGIGIDPEDQEEIFEVFHRLHSHEEHPGTGIGLSLCQRIVERHGGDIEVDSEPGDGTTISFTLPAAE